MEFRLIGCFQEGAMPEDLRKPVKWSGLGGDATPLPNLHGLRHRPQLVADTDVQIPASHRQITQSIQHHKNQVVLGTF